MKRRLYTEVEYYTPVSEKNFTVPIPFFTYLYTKTYALSQWETSIRDRRKLKLY